MKMFKLLSRAATMGILLAITVTVHADDLQDANKLFKEGHADQALEKVNAFLAGKPKDAQGRFLKGLIFADQGKTADAISVFSSLTEDYPELPEPYNNLAVLYAGQGQYEKAKTKLEMAIRTNPTYATAHENLGDIYAKMASQAYDRALQLEKNNSNANTKTKLALIRELFSKNAHNTNAVSTHPAEPAPASRAAAAAPAAAPAAQPAATPAPDVAPKPVAVAAAPTDPGADVLKATRNWAAAWSAKNSTEYLSFYGREFKVPGGRSRSTWEAQRKAHIAAPKSIRVEIRDAKAKVTDDNHASISFKQIYHTPRRSLYTAKVLDWVKTGDHWKIAEERTGR